MATDEGEGDVVQNGGAEKIDERNDNGRCKEEGHSYVESGRDELTFLRQIMMQKDLENLTITRGPRIIHL